MTHFYSNLLANAVVFDIVPAMKVVKFGGSSVQNAGHIKNVVDIVAERPEIEVVVCSAMKGVTNSLIDAAQRAEAGKKDYTALLDAIWEKNLDAASQLVGREHRVLSDMADELVQLREICHGVFLVKECSPRSLDLIMSFGERLCNRLVAAYAGSRGMDACYLDARPLILTDGSHGNAQVDFAESYRRISRHFSSAKGIAFVTGFIASNGEGITTTLGRNGSDYSAAIFGAALKADDIEIWTDVDGVLEADPRVVPEAGVISELGIEEALELSYFGAEVLHPSTMIPAIETNIPVWIKNTLNVSARGTRIAADAAISDKVLTGIASIQNVSLINIAGSGMIGARGTAMKIFAALARADVNAIMISQASSEHSVCVVIRSKEVQAAMAGLRSELAGELSSRHIQEIQLHQGLEVVAIIGAKMRGTPGVSGKLFSALGACNINILAIAQGSSEMNISFVISEKDRENCLQTIHRAFFRGEGK